MVGVVAPCLMKLLTTKGLQAFMRVRPGYSPIQPEIVPKVKNYKLDESQIEQVRKLRKTHSVQHLAKQFNCSPLAISMYAPKKNAALKLEKELWDKSSLNRQLTKIRKYQRKALW